MPAHRLTRLLLAFVAAVGLAAAAPSSTPPTPRNALLLGGRWWNGSRFVARGETYVASGRFVEHRPARVDTVLRLGDAFVVPPFGDAHTHSLDGLRRFAAQRDNYLREGTFYVQVLTNYRAGALAVRDSVGRPHTLDVTWAHGGLTSTLGHPFTAYEPRAMGITGDWSLHADSISRSRIGENGVYWFLDSEADVEAKWPRILAGGPDVIKIFLLDSEHYEATRRSGRLGDKGLDPRLVPGLVRRAHAAGLRVWAHVETAYDFHVGVEAGVDGFAHLPGYGLASSSDPASFRIAEADARRFGRRGGWATPTVGAGVFYSGRDTARIHRIRALQRENVARLLRHGARVVVGSDQYGLPAAREARELRELGVWDAAGALKVWAEATPRAIFPGRRIGRLAPGYEASLLVLSCDPLADWECTGRITTRIKQGALLPEPPPAR